MESSITINIVEPGGPTPDPVVPNTGLFTHGIGGPEATIITITSAVLLLTIVAIVLAVLYKKHKSQNKTTKLVHLVDNTKAIITNKKRVTATLTAIALLASVGTFIALAKNAANATDADDQAEGEGDSNLTVDVSSTELTIELDDEPVFAVLPVDITVEEATALGYTLTAFAEDTNLVSTTDSSNIIPMVASEDTPVALTANTYGLSFTDPESALDEVFTSLSTDSTAPTFITDKDYLATEANDTTTIYYGFYITPDTPYGTYTGSNISVDATANIATVTFDANGLYFNDSGEATINTVGYKPNIAQSPIEEVTGEYMTPAPLTPVDPSTTIHYTFLGWSESEGATTPTYTNEEDILANLTLTKNESLTLYAVWHYDTVLSFNGTTSDGGTPIPDQTIAAGTTITLPHNTYTRTGSVFTGWNTVETPTPDNPGKSYTDEASFTAPNESADITLYAQWAYTTTITFNGNGATGGTMSPQTVVAGTPETLTPNAFTKTNATFIGWNTQANGSGTSYSDEAEFTASTEQHQDITLYAQWAYTTISFNGNTSDAGTMNPITIAGGTTSNLPAKAFTKNNCIFTGWNTEANGTGISYGDSTPYTANATTIEAFTLYAQWQCISQVNYYGNGATSGEMASSIILGGSTLTLSQNTYTKDGYVFNGWNTQPNGTGTSYPDQGSFTAPMTPATTLNLYAQWKQVFYMQDVATWGSTLSQGDTIEAVDKRDEQEYTVARLADNKIWMTKNLNLAGGTVITSELSNVPDNYTLPTANGFQSGNKLPASSTSGFSSDAMAYVYNSTKTSGTGCTSRGCYSYYSWTAATAGSGLSITDDNTDAPYSICPKGWKLPNSRSTVAGNSDFYQLAVAYGMNPSSTSQSTANFFSQAGPGTTPNFLLTGYYNNSSFLDGGSGGSYWSSTSGSSPNARSLYFNSSNVYSASNYGRRYGRAVRCIAE